MNLLGIGKGLLKLIPGVGQAVSAMEMVGDVAEAIGGDTGREIKEGIDKVTSGLQRVGQQPLTPEQQAQMEEVGHRHAERMRELDVEDAQGGRDLAAKEVASQDEYVRRTRPKLLRIYGYGTIGLVFSSVAVAFIAAFSASVTKDEATFVVDVLKWALPSVSGTFLMMYRVYVGRRTDEKLAEAGMPREGFMDKLVKLKTGGS